MSFTIVLSQPFRLASSRFNRCRVEPPVHGEQYKKMSPGPLIILYDSLYRGKVCEVLFFSNVKYLQFLAFYWFRKQIALFHNNNAQTQYCRPEPTDPSGDEKHRQPKLLDGP